MADLVRVTYVPKEPRPGSEEIEIFKGNLQSLVYAHGTKTSNPLIGFVSKRVHYIYVFYRWTRGIGWVPCDDPRPVS